MAMPDGKDAPRFPDYYYANTSDYARARLRHQRRRQEVAQRHDMTLRQYELLLVLRASTGYPHTSIGELAELLEIESNTTTALLDRMEKQGLIKRTHAARGIVYPLLTAKGQATLDAALVDMAAETDYGDMATITCYHIRALVHFPAAHEALGWLKESLRRNDITLET